MTSSIYSERIKALISQLDNPVVLLIVGNGVLSRSADTSYSFKQDSNVLYISGLQNPGICVLIDCKNNKTYIVEPTTNKIEKIFDDPFIPDQSQEYVKYDSVISEKQALTLINSLSISGKVYMNMPAPAYNSGVYSNPHRKSWHNKLRRNKITGIHDLRIALARQRMIKNSSEIQYITTASTITKQAMKELVPLITSTTTEKELEYMFTAYFASQNTQHAYTPIVASDDNAAILHHMSTTKSITNDTCLLLDIGAEFNNYAADISRTYIIGANNKIQILINEVSAVQSELIGMVAPGMTMQLLQNHAKKLLHEVSKHYGLDEDIEHLFPHSIGHHLGLDVHDAADYAQPLAENMVITVEPGLYSKRLGMGIRIEDDILVTKNGSKTL